MAEEQKKKSYSERYKRYRERHKLVRVGATLQIEEYNAFLKKLGELDMTQQQFIKSAIDKFLEE